MKLRPMGAELLHENRRTDKTNLTDALRNFASAPKNGYEKWCSSNRSTSFHSPSSSSSSSHVVRSARASDLFVDLLLRKGSENGP